MTAGPVTGPVRRGARWLHWYLRELTGESAYDRHVAHLRAEHPDAPVPSRRDFERRRMDERYARPQTRCC